MTKGLTKRLNRQDDFELSLVLKNEQFIRPPRDRQRNWLLNRSMSEFVQDIKALDHLAAGFVPGVDNLELDDRTQAELADQEIMEDWQIPIMRAMAQVVAESHGDILEIGFGRGIGSDLIQQQDVKSHAIIECNRSIIGRFERWKQHYPDRDIRMLPGLWQDVLPNLGSYDGIFFHTYPLNEADFVEQIGESSTFAEHFFPHAAQHLETGGIFTYLSNEMDSLSRHHQRLLFKHFSRIEISQVQDLVLPERVVDQWWSDSMIIVKAVK